MNKATVIISLLFAFWSAGANAYQCENITGVMPNRPGTPIPMIPNKIDPSRFEGITTTRDGLTEVKVVISPVKRSSLLNEGNSGVTGLNLRIELTGPESAPGSNTIAATMFDGSKNGPELHDFKMSIYARVNADSGIRVQCRGE